MTILITLQSASSSSPPQCSNAYCQPSPASPSTQLQPLASSAVDSEAITMYLTTYLSPAISDTQRTDCPQV